MYRVMIHHFKAADEPDDMEKNAIYKEKQLSIMYFVLRLVSIIQTKKGLLWDGADCCPCPSNSI